MAHSIINHNNLPPPTRPTHHTLILLALNPILTTSQFTLNTCALRIFLLVKVSYMMFLPVQCNSSTNPVVLEQSHQFLPGQAVEAVGVAAVDANHGDDFFGGETGWVRGDGRCGVGRSGARYGSGS